MFVCWRWFSRAIGCVCVGGRWFHARCHHRCGCSVCVWYTCGCNWLRGVCGWACVTDCREQHRQFLRSQQQRLLLLRHATKCTAPIGQCTATPFCGPMKELWPHLSKCHDNPCSVRHCVSSRYVLSHYHRCRGPCEVCPQVREAIRLQDMHLKVRTPL